MCPSLEPTVSPAPRYDMHHGIWTGPRSGPPSGQLGVLCAGLVGRVSLHGTIIHQLSESEAKELILFTPSLLHIQFIKKSF